MKVNTVYKIGAASAIALLAGAVWTAPLMSGYNGKEVRIVIPHNASESAVADTLTKYLGDDYASHVERALSLPVVGGTPQVGSYVVSPGAMAVSTARRLARQRQTPVRLTFNNVRTMDQLAQRLSRGMLYTPQQFMEAADSVLPQLGYKQRAMYPAAFMPDSYEFYATESPDKVIRRITEYTAKFWNDERCQKAQQLGLTPQEVAVVASIAEEETASPAERGTVGRLYINRVHKGMRLQADPTVKFALDNFSLKRIYGKMLDTPSAYNTYRVEGLPPGPIRVPEQATIDSILNSAPHPYIYMCADSRLNGRHLFTADYAQHQANARAYQARINQLGITR